VRSVFAASERSNGIPDVATFAEQGLKDQEADTLTGIVAPAGNPERDRRPAFHARSPRAWPAPISMSASRCSASREWAIRPSSSEARIKLEIEKWGKVVRDANLRIE